MQEIRFEKATSFKQKPQDESKLGFGKLFTDYMFEMDYSVEKGWHDPRVVPYHDFGLPLRPGNLRGPQVLSPQGRRPAAVPRQGQFRPHEPLGRAHGDSPV